jgi:hypothetical protein
MISSLDTSKYEKFDDQWLTVKRKDSYFERSLLMYKNVYIISLKYSFDNIQRGTYNLYIRHALTSDPKSSCLREEMYLIICVKAINSAIVLKKEFIPDKMYVEMLNKIDVLDNYLVCKFTIPDDCDMEKYFDEADMNLNYFTIDVSFINNDLKMYKTGWLIDAVFLNRVDDNKKLNNN